MRTTIDVVETQIDEVMPKADRPILHAAIVQYSREVAFSAAEIYARAAELRGAWDERLEALVVDAVLRGETDETVLSRASTLGWHSTATVVVVVGPAPELEPALALESIRHTAAIAGTRHARCGPGRPDGGRAGRPGAGHRRSRARRWWASSPTSSGPGAVVVGPPVDHLMEAATSTREAVAGLPRRGRLARGSATGRCPTTCCPSGRCPGTGTPAGRWPAASTTRCSPPAAGCWRPW